MKAIKSVSAKPVPTLTANLDAVRAQAKAHSSQLAAGAAQPAPAVQAAHVAVAATQGAYIPVQPQGCKAQILRQFNVRLSPDARTRLRAAAHSWHVSEQELIERWALTLPVPVAAPRMPWESATY